MPDDPGASALLEIADALYALTLPEFTPARDARSTELKSADADLARQVKALRKPSTAAWVVNLLVRHEGAQVEQVLTVGEALREAQAGMSADELRALTRQRRQLTAAVTTRARGVASTHGVKVTRAVADQVEATLTAAMVDPGCAKALRSGLLVSALATTGVDEVELAVAVALPDALGFSASPRTAPSDGKSGARPDLRVVPDPEADRAALAAAQESLDSAETQLAEARSAYDEAVAEVGQLEARSMQVQAEIDELRGRLIELEASVEEVDDELGDAEDARSESEAALRGATKARDAAAEALAKLAD